MTTVIAAHLRFRADNIDMSARSWPRAVVVAVVLVVSGTAFACSSPPVDPTPEDTDTTGTSIPASGSERDCPPTLDVTSPLDGARVATPFPLTYETHCFSMDRDGTIYFTADGISLDLRPQNPAGTITVPDHPLLSGRRTVTIQLADDNGRPLNRPDTTIIITIIIEGSRDAG